MPPEIPFAVEVLFQVFQNNYTRYWEKDRRYCLCIFKCKRPYKRDSCAWRCLPSRCSACCQKVKNALCKTMKERFHDNYWTPGNPLRGHGFRKMEFTYKKMDRLLVIALERCGYEVKYNHALCRLFTQLPITMYVDPGRVTFYLQDGCEVKELDPSKDDAKKVDIANMLTRHPPHCGRAANRDPWHSFWPCYMCEGKTAPLSNSSSLPALIARV